MLLLTSQLLVNFTFCSHIYVCVYPSLPPTLVPSHLLSVSVSFTVEQSLQHANTDDVVAQQTKLVDTGMRQYIETFNKPRRGSRNHPANTIHSPSHMSPLLLAKNFFSKSRHALDKFSVSVNLSMAKAKEMGINTWEFPVLDFAYEDMVLHVLTLLSTMYS